MKAKSILDAKGPAVKIAFYGLIVTMSIILPGCCKQSAAFEQSQLKLQAMDAPKAHQLSCMAPQIVQNQRELHGENAAIGNNARLVAADMAVVSDAQMKMQQTLQTNGQNLTNTLPIVEQHQRNLCVEIRDVQSSTHAVGGL